MRFLLDLVPCFGSPHSKAGPSDHVDNARTLVTPPPPPPPPLRVRNTARTRSWSPSFCAISEDRALMTTTGGSLVVAQRKVAASGGNTRRTSRGRGPGSAPYKVEYGHGQGYLSGAMIPAFSPAPFVF